MTGPDQPFYRPGGRAPLPSGNPFPPVDYPEHPDPYRTPRLPETNSVATASLVTSALGIPLGVPLTLLCSIGVLIPVIGIVLGVAALAQIKRTGQGGRELAIGGIVLGAVVLVLLTVLVVVFFAAAITLAG